MHFKNLLFSHTRRSAHAHVRGFGLVELMVSVSIMTLVSTVVLVKNRSFNNALLLRTQAYEVAFSLRQMQLLAVSGNRETSTSSDRYGIYFNLASTTNNHRYQFFNDNILGTTHTNWYTQAGNPDTPLGAGSIDGRYHLSISDATGAATNATNLAVTFERPNFDAIFMSAAGTSVPGPVFIKVSPRDTTGYSGVVPFRLIEITSTGQISVK